MSSNGQKGNEENNIRLALAALFMLGRTMRSSSVGREEACRLSLSDADELLKQHKETSRP